MNDCATTKRPREDPEENGNQEKKRCAVRWARKKSCNSSHGEQRSGGGDGVVTDVGASSLPFKTTTTAVITSTTPPPSSSAPAPVDVVPTISSYLLHLRKLAFKALNFRQSIPELVRHVSEQFLVSPTEASWSEECETVLTALYIALHHPDSFTPLFAKEVVVQFIKRWVADYEDSDVLCISRLITNNKKYTNFSTLLLIFGNHFPNDIEAVCLKECLSWCPEWSQNNGAPPDWLLDVAEHKDDIVSIRKLLFASVMMLKGVPWDIDILEGYAGTMTALLAACQCYKTAEYKQALAILQGINNEKSSNDLQGWILWLMGLCLFHLSKPHIALVKLQAAVDKCDSCIPAIFNISQVFSKLCIETAELETLSLLCEGGKEWNPYSVANLHSSLLRLHHPPPDNLSCQALYLMATRSFQMKKYKDSCSHFSFLLQKLQDSDWSPNPNQHSLLRPEDDIPELPSYEKIIILQALAQFQAEDFEAVLTSVSHLVVQDVRHFSYYEDTEDKKISCLITVTAYWIKAEALAKVDKTDDALRECSRLERVLSFVRGTSSSGWETCILMFRVLTLWTLSVLHSLKNNSQSHNHFKRLAKQSLQLLPQDRSKTLWESQSLSSKLIMDNIFCIVNDRLSMVQ